MKHIDLMTVDLTTTQLRVDAGMEFLDRKMPGWEHYIHLHTLELSNGCECILGQIGTKKYDSLVEEKHLTGYGTLVVEFNLPIELQESLGFFCSNPFNYELLNEVWRDKIKERLTANKEEKEWGKVAKKAFVKRSLEEELVPSCVLSPV